MCQVEENVMSETFGQRLSRIRKEKGMTQEDIAKRIVISPQAVSKWENDISSPDILVLSSLADILGVSVDELLGREESSPKEAKVDDVEEPEVEEVETEVIDESNSRPGVTIDENGLHAENQKGAYVHLGGKGVEIKGEKTITINDDGVKVDGVKVSKQVKKTVRSKAARWIPTGTLFGLAIIGYILMGIYWPDQNMGWKCGWTIFLFVISLDSLYEAIIKRRFCSFAYPVLVTGVYCMLGFTGDYFHTLGWGFYWFLFLTIPAFYLLFGPIDSKLNAIKEEREE